MKKNTKTESGFELFERMTNGRCNSLYSQNPEIPIILITKTTINFGKCAYEKIGLNEKNRYILAKKDDVFYISILGIDSKIKGYKVNQVSPQVMRSSSKTFIERGVVEQAYKILDPILINGVDWFELEIFTDN